MYFNHCYSSFEFAWFAITSYIWTTLTTLAPSRTFYRSENHLWRVPTSGQWPNRAPPPPRANQFTSSYCRVDTCCATIYSQFAHVLFFKPVGVVLPPSETSYQLKTPVRGFFILGASFFQPVLCRDFIAVNCTRAERCGALFQPFFHFC
jgi:hypothetical protein